MACKHTKDINYARNFRKMRPEIKESGFGEKDLRSEYVQTAESEKRKQFSMSGQQVFKARCKPLMVLTENPDRDTCGKQAIGGKYNGDERAGETGDSKDQKDC